jgi:uncharacterized protein with NAD-binding domain and iron-sulfur cluster
VRQNGTRIALAGGGPASLTLARDPAPLGYRCVIIDQDPKAGGMMRTKQNLSMRSVVALSRIISLERRLHLLI